MANGVEEPMEVSGSLSAICTPCVPEEYTPQIGMQFESEGLAYDFYSKYGKLGGFSIRRDYCTKSRTDKVMINRKIVCAKEGEKVVDKRGVHRHRRETRTNCLAFMYIAFNRDDGRWVVTKFEASHNHPLDVPEVSHMMPAQQNLPSAQSRFGAQMEPLQQELARSNERIRELTAAIAARDHAAAEAQIQRTELVGRAERAEQMAAELKAILQSRPGASDLTVALEAQIAVLSREAALERDRRIAAEQQLKDFLATRAVSSRSRSRSRSVAIMTDASRVQIHEAQPRVLPGKEVKHEASTPLVVLPLRDEGPVRDETVDQGNAPAS